MNFAEFFSIAHLRRFWLPILVVCLVVAVFFAAPFVAIYRKARAVVPGADAVLPAK